MADRSTAARIADAALAILHEEGADAVTMRRVAAATGITPMAIYKHYPNRRALLRTAADTAFADIGAAWDRPRPDDFTERCDSLMNDFLDFALGKPNLYAFLLAERRDEARRFPEDFADGASPTFAPVVALMNDGMREGILRRDDPLETALVITSHTQGLVQLYLAGRIGLSETDFRALCRRTVQRIFDGLKA
ncbi:TetR family transcriptional regulator [Stackebrandtia albiflava]|uniref:TetR family transcriptional regulator n=1 Tax=Stackebrandtia albiflava TaxID=406432 RepID=A0A562V3J2_9ACTN|nr:TetR/AcrR family transcriptional regulator [Stackebrandtia albiflava]TWJ12392.1 TetR family transcriptional regulator [Stackebrandtia albiflava]